MAIKLNVIDRPKADYTGGPSSLCPGCGHDQISNVNWSSKVDDFGWIHDAL